METEEEKSVTTKLKVGKKLSFGELIGEAVKFLLGKGTTEVMQAASGYASQLAASGDASKLTASGDASIVVSAGVDGRVKASLGSFISCAEWKFEADKWKPVALLAGRVDNKELKADTWYTVKNGKWIKAD